MEGRRILVLIGVWGNSVTQSGGQTKLIPGIGVCGFTGQLIAAHACPIPI